MGIEPALQIVELPEHIVSTPSAAGGVVVRAFPIILPRLGRTPVSFGLGFAIGLVLSHAITQRPVVEKIVSPDILVLVTPPMLAPVPLLILRFGLGTTPSMIVAALAVGSMVTINSATESWRTDGVRIARARLQGLHPRSPRTPRAHGVAVDRRGLAVASWLGVEYRPPPTDTLVARACDVEDQVKHDFIAPPARLGDGA